MKKTTGFVLLLLAWVAILSAQNTQKIIPVDSPVYKALDTLYVEQGYTLPSQSLPYSLGELLFYLERLDYEKLSSAGKKAYDYILNQTEEKVVYNEGKDFLFNSSLELNLESYLKLNNTRTDWIYGYEKRKPLIKIPLEVWFFDSLYADLELAIKQGPFVIEQVPDNHFNLITEPYQVDLGFPFRAFLSLGGDHWYLQFGRDALSWGNGKSGNLMLAGSAGSLDFLRFALFWDRFKFTSAYVALEPWLLSGEGTGGEELYKAFFGHRLEFRLTNWLQLALSESIIFGKKYPDLRYLNPVMVFHNWYIKEWSNSLITAELSYTPIRYLNLYGQFALDQLRTPPEEATFHSKESNALGYLVGVQSDLPLGPGFLQTDLEWVYANPWLYTTNNILLSYTSRRRITAETISYLDRPLGLYTGTDSQVVSAAITYALYGQYSLGLDFRYEQWGKNTIYTLYNDAGSVISNLTALGEHPSHRYIFGLHGSWYPFKDVNFQVGSDLSWVKGTDYQDLEWTSFVTFIW